MNEEVGVGACGKPALWFSKQRWTGSHGCGSVHPVVELREGVRDLHHLTGHYPVGCSDNHQLTGVSRAVSTLETLRRYFDARHERKNERDLETAVVKQQMG